MDPERSPLPLPLSLSGLAVAVTYTHIHAHTHTPVVAGGVPDAEGLRFRGEAEAERRENGE